MAPLSADARIFAARPILAWTLFALSAGFVNAVALMACNNFVTHITGNVTNIAVDPEFARAFLFVVASFVGGSMLATLMNETLAAKRGLGFVLPILLAFATLVGVALAGKAGAFGPFGVSQTSPAAFTMLGLLAVAMGMINASIAMATANKIRITHLTGPATDLGGNLMRAMLGAGEGSGAELRWAALRLTKLVAFALGATLGARAAGSLQYDAFVAAAAILIVALGFIGGIDAGAVDDVGAPEVEGVHDAVPETSSARDRRITRYEDASPPLPALHDRRSNARSQNAG